MTIPFETIKTTVIPILKSNDVNYAALFGSYARNEATENSDIDIAYRTNIPLNLSQFSELSSALAKVFNTTSDKIDLANLAQVTPLLSFLVSQEGVLLIGTPEADDKFYRASVMKHIDAAPLYQAKKQYIQLQYT